MINEGNSDWEKKNTRIINGHKMALLGMTKKLHIWRLILIRKTFIPNQLRSASVLPFQKSEGDAGLLETFAFYTHRRVACKVWAPEKVKIKTMIHQI